MTLTNPYSRSARGRLALRLRRDLSPDEAVRQQVRKRLLRYILASHRRRITARGRARYESAAGDTA